jgi:bifunctional UDP-N-acetylglucosamine pyrophosphorylase/glucosamine-1-phosphate N-acetyltransferase
MRSELPKVLQPLAGRPLLEHVLDTSETLRPEQIIVVYGHGGEQVREHFADRQLSWVEQAPQLGTGHAVQQAMPSVDASHTVIVMSGDVPLVRPETVRSLASAAGDQNLAVLTVDADQPAGYGRIVRGGAGEVLAIVEERDATDDQRKLKEINTGLLACPARLLGPWLETLKAENAQGEYYLTDVAASAAADGVRVNAVSAESETEVMGINDKLQLAQAERAYQARIANELMLNGVTLVDPQRIDVRGQLECDTDVFIDMNVLLEGNVKLGHAVTIGPNCVIRDSTIADGTTIHANSLLDSAVVGKNCSVGPYARLRPGAEMAEESRVGNFVEVKKSTIGKGSKVNHLSYIGDSEIGADVNVGAGTITCNYDGANKQRTIIGDNAFIGSGVELVAPVEIGVGATIGAGSTVSKDAPANKLTIERARQKTVPNWQRPVKKKD